MGTDAVFKLIETLRGKNGCPWDKKQTPRTIAVYLVEEIYELVDAIESENHNEICEELGDVLFHILFLISLFRETGRFDFMDVIDSNMKKMTRRHPHVFGKDRVESTDEVREQWHKIKMNEKKRFQETSILDSVPSKLPALMRAYRISERASKTGFDWSDISGVMSKVEEEWSELKVALKGQKESSKDHDLLAMELGDLIFTLVNVARFACINPETALRSSTNKFEKRFKYMERLTLKNHGGLESISQEDLDVLWEKSKSKIG